MGIIASASAKTEAVHLARQKDHVVSSQAEQIGVLQSELLQAQAAYRQEVVESKSTRQNLQDRLDEQLAINSRLRLELESQTAQLKNLQESQERLDSAQSRWQAAQTELLAAARTSWTNAQAELLSSTHKQWRETQCELLKGTTDKWQQLQDTVAAGCTTSEEATTLAAEKDKLNAEKQILEEKVTRLDGRLQHHLVLLTKLENESREAESKSDKERQELRDKLSSSTERVAELEKELEASVKKHEELESKLKVEQQKIVSLQELVDAKKSLVDSLQMARSNEVGLAVAASVEKDQLISSLRLQVMQTEDAANRAVGQMQTERDQAVAELGRLRSKLGNDACVFGSKVEIEWLEPDLCSHFYAQWAQLQRSMSDEAVRVCIGEPPPDWTSHLAYRMQTSVESPYLINMDVGDQALMGLLWRRQPV
mmetsp:Transcript_4346/g.10156  ORF Transcript_4346/g.10156 Transcript_4346/m.10156 type:complete len:425 (+) Transcript_4346:102-1376(+)